MKIDDWDKGAMFGISVVLIALSIFSIFLEIEWYILLMTLFFYIIFKLSSMKVLELLERRRKNGRKKANNRN